MRKPTNEIPKFAWSDSFTPGLVLFQDVAPHTIELAYLVLFRNGFHIRDFIMFSVYITKNNLFLINDLSFNEKYYLYKSNIKNNIKYSSVKLRSQKNNFINLLESRIDIVLLRSYFAINIRSARQLISHGKVKVNGKIVKNNSLILKLNIIEFMLNSLLHIIPLQRTNYK